MNPVTKNIIRGVIGAVFFAVGGVTIFNAGCQHATTMFDVVLKNLDPETHEKVEKIIFNY